MTDGVFEQVCPKLMRKNTIDVNIPLARKFLDWFSCSEDDVPEIEEYITGYLEHYPSEYLDDDKTVIILINQNRIPAMKEEDYYAIPDWDSLYKESEKKLWEHDLSSSDGSDSVSNTNEVFNENKTNIDKPEEVFATAQENESGGNTNTLQDKKPDENLKKKNKPFII